MSTSLKANFYTGFMRRATQLLPPSTSNPEEFEEEEQDDERREIAFLRSVLTGAPFSEKEEEPPMVRSFQCYLKALKADDLNPAIQTLCELSVEKKSIEALLLEMLLLLNAGRGDLALKLKPRLVSCEENGDSDECLMNLAQVYIMVLTGNYMEAYLLLGDLEESLGIESSSDSSSYIQGFKGGLKLQMHEFQSAIDHLKLALSLDSTNESALKNLISAAYLSDNKYCSIAEIVEYEKQAAFFLQEKLQEIEEIFS